MVSKTLEELTLDNAIIVKSSSLLETTNEYLTSINSTYSNIRAYAKVRHNNEIIDLYSYVEPKEVINITVTYDLNYEVSNKIEVINHPKGTILSAKSEPARANFNFLGWFEVGASSPYIFGSEVLEDLVLVAGWEEIVIPQPEPTNTVVAKSLATEFMAMPDGDNASLLNLDNTIFTTSKSGNVNLYSSGVIGPHGGGSITFNINSEYTIKKIKVNVEQSTGTTNIKLGATQPTSLQTGSVAMFSDLNIDYVTISNTGGKMSQIVLLEITYSSNEPLVTHNVSFDTDGGSNVSSQIVQSETTIRLPNQPTKEGFFFDGWFTNNSYTNQYDFNSFVTNDTTLYAKWLKDDGSIVFFDVTYYTDQYNVHTVQSVRENTKTLAPSAPIRDGYKFIGWTLEMLEFDFETVINDNLAIYALWEELPDVTLGSYYLNRGIEDASGNELKDLLRIRLNDGIKLSSYGGNLNTPLLDADKHPTMAGMVRVIYDDFPMSVNAGGSSGPLVWNKEHVIPRSWYAGSVGHLGDVHNLRIANAQTNSDRGNRYFSDSTGGWKQTGGGFYPGDGHQGDTARIVMYMMTMFPSVITEQKTFGGANAVDILYKWHTEDPVDDFEIRRNDILYGFQKNRNPFIDHPEFFERIWQTDQLNYNNNTNDNFIDINVYNNQIFTNQLLAA